MRRRRGSPERPGRRRRPALDRTMRHIVFIVAFFAAVVALRESYAAWSGALQRGAAQDWAMAIGLSIVLIAAFLYAGFLVYEADRRAGKLRRRLGLYERFLRGS